MSLQQILTQAAQKDLSHKGLNGLIYSELIKDGKFEIKLSSTTHPEAFIECSIPNTGIESEENYLRMHFISMVYNAAIHGMKRMNTRKNRKNKKTI